MLEHLFRSLHQSDKGHASSTREVKRNFASLLLRGIFIKSLTSVSLYGAKGKKCGCAFASNGDGFSLRRGHAHDQTVGDVKRNRPDRKVCVNARQIFDR